MEKFTISGTPKKIIRHAKKQTKQNKTKPHMTLNKEKLANQNQSRTDTVVRMIRAGH